MSGKKELLKVPKKALEFKEHIDNSTQVELKKEEGKKPTLVMKAHSGKPMNHWYYEKLAVDTSGVKFNGSRFPVLQEHYSSDKIGSSGKLELRDDHSLHINPDNFKFLSNKNVEEFISNSESGFPYQASISIRPTKIETLKEGTSAEVNGYTLKGPATILRESNYRETSVCVWGADSNTESKVGKFNEDEMIELSDCEIVEVQLTEEFREADDNNINKEGIVPLTIEELEEKHPELFTKVKELGAEDSRQESDVQENTVITDLTKVVENLSNKFLEVEKSNMLTAEKLKQKEQADEAEKVYTEKFSEMNLRSDAAKKVRKLCNFKSFVTEGKLNVEDFTKALDAELKDWEDFTEMHEEPVHGGFSNASNRQKTSASQVAKNTDLAADDLFASISLDNDGGSK